MISERKKVMKNKNQLKQQLDKIYFKKCDENNIPYYGARDIIGSSCAWE